MGGCVGKNARTETATYSTTPSTSSETKIKRVSAVSSLEVEPKVQYVAIWDHKAVHKAELSLKVGDIVEPTGQQGDAGPEWLFVHTVAGNARRAGYVPVTILAVVGSVEAEPWYFGNLKRPEAESLLLGQPDGTFLVRHRPYPEPGKQPSVYIISVAVNKTVRHFIIKENLRSGKVASYELSGRPFPSLQEMVTSYREQPIGRLVVLTEYPERPAPKCPTLPPDVEKKWREIPRSQLSTEVEVGRGYFGVVYKGTWKVSEGITLPVAIKELRAGMITARQQFLDEAISMRNLLHDNLVRLHGVVSVDDPIWIITEFMKDGSLKFYLRSRAKAGNSPTQLTLADVARQIASGMHYLETNRIVHRDLAARNVLINEQLNSDDKKTLQRLTAKIADFGMAQMVKGRSVTARGMVNIPIKWTAPEALQKGRFSSASDVWSFGVLLYELFTNGSEPFEGMTLDQVRTLVVKEKGHVPLKTSIPTKVLHLINSCCNQDPAARPKFDSLRDTFDLWDSKVDDDGHYLRVGPL